MLKICNYNLICTFTFLFLTLLRSNLVSILVISLWLEKEGAVLLEEIWVVINDLLNTVIAIVILGIFKRRTFFNWWVMSICGLQSQSYSLSLNVASGLLIAYILNYTFVVIARFLLLVIMALLFWMLCLCHMLWICVKCRLCSIFLLFESIWLAAHQIDNK